MINRDECLNQLTREIWDVLVIGGGATGLGSALDAASRGYRTLLLEQSDFAKATSSRSTKLIHGGVRYLRQGNIGLVRESLHERGLLLRNAAEFVHPIEFVIPTSTWMETFYYAAGLKVYDLLAGQLAMAGSQRLSAEEMLVRVPTLRRDDLSGGVSYYDAQFDDARLAVALALAVHELGAVALNYVSVVNLQKQGGKLHAAIAEDQETGRRYEVTARSVINAGGIFSDDVRRLADPNAPPMLQLSQGTHIVLDRAFLPGNTAIIVPKTDDGRILFLIPWNGAVLVGTTDIPVATASLEPVPQAQEIEFLLRHAGRYLSQPPRMQDIRSCFSGLRPLVRSPEQTTTSKLSRDHVVKTSSSGLVTVTGGKWTTYRKMAIDAVDAAAKAGGLPVRPSRTEGLKLQSKRPELAYDLPQSGVIPDDLISHSVRAEMARTVEDILARRNRVLFTNARAAMAAAPSVAWVLARELSRDEAWARSQVDKFKTLAMSYLPPGVS
jgi:glycerol-3-phosphate dehydrogenase